MKRKYKRLFKGISVAVIIAALIGAAWHVGLFERKTVADHGGEAEDAGNKQVISLNAPEDPLSVDGFTAVDVDLGAGKIILQTNCSAIAMTTSVEKTYSIQRGRESKEDVRPNEHDILAEVMGHYEVDVLFVKINDIKNDVYFADVVMQHEKSVLSLDVKPSDAIALAERFGAPVYVKTAVLEETGQRVC